MEAWCLSSLLSTKKIVVLTQEATVKQAARAMCDHQIGCVVVADGEGHIIGIVTDRDIVCRFSTYSLQEDTPVSEIMTDEIETVAETADLNSVIGLMEKSGVRRIPVIHLTESKKQKCVGIITLDDLIASQSIGIEQLSRIVQAQIFRRRKAATSDLRQQQAQERSEAHLE